MSPPSEKDIIIPEPCFNIRELLDFKFLSNTTTESSQSVPDTLFESLKQYIHPSVSSIDVFLSSMYQL